VNTGRISFDKARFVGECYYKALPEIRKAKEGDLLFTVTGSYGIVIPVNTNRKFCFQRHIGLIKTITSSSWIRFVLQSNYVQSYCDSIATGTAQKTVSLGHLRNLIIPIPPEKEQVRIINELELWLNKVEIIQRNECDLKRLLSFAKSIILDLSIHGNLVPQDPADEPAADLLKRVNPNAAVSTDTSHYKFDTPNNWIIRQLGSLFNHNTGKALNRSNQEGRMLDYITTSNLYWDRFELNNLKQMPFKDSEIDKCTVIKGDLLVCEGGDVGRAAIWNYDYSICIQNHIHRLRPIDNHLVFPRFYYYCFLLYKQQNLIGGKGIGIQGLSSNQLHKVVFPLPPLNEQKRIASKVDELFAVIDQIQQSLE